MTPSVTPVAGLTVSATAAPGVVQLVLDRPERRNALTEQMMVGLGPLGAELSADPEVRVVVLSGAGPGFCAGADRDVVASRSGQYLPHRRPQPMGREAELLASFEMPVISAVHGAAVGLGMGVALAADICVADATAYFAEAHLALGLCPTAMCWWLARNSGLQRAAEIILTGRRVPAEEAGAIGLVARTVPAGEAVAEALRIADSVAAMPPLTTRSAKYAFHLAQDWAAMQRVREFGGAANIIARTAAAAGGASA
jgi:enoyl-CoA hydratase/carnithine racemase